MSCSELDFAKEDHAHKQAPHSQALQNHNHPKEKIEWPAHNHEEHSHSQIESRLSALEEGRPKVDFTGQEAKAIRELLKQSPFINVE